MEGGREGWREGERREGGREEGREGGRMKGNHDYHTSCASYHELGVDGGDPLHGLKGAAMVRIVQELHHWAL